MTRAILLAGSIGYHGEAAVHPPLTAVDHWDFHPLLIGITHSARFPR
jgi:hypothetical protein